MADSPLNFGETARGLSRNPLGIIALFIVLVYGTAALVTGAGGGLTEVERLPLIYFLVCFPVLVLAVFTWLVSKHTSSLYGPGDFRDEDNWVKMQLEAVASLTAAAARGDANTPQPEVHNIVRSVVSSRMAARAISGDRSKEILWVDDRPENNVFERKAFEAIGFRVSLALSTSEALEKLAQQRFAAVISDMGRKEGPREGYVLLDRLRAAGNQVPFFVYAGSRGPEFTREVLSHGGQGTTNQPEELFKMVTDAVTQYA